MTPRFLSLLVIAPGLLFGGLLRYFVPEKGAVSEGALVQVPSSPDSDPVQERAPDPGPRPTFDEVMQIHGASESTVLVRYLADATLEETIELMEAFVEETRLADLLWMVQMRGLELDPDEMLAWAKAKGSGFLRMHFRIWALVDPKAALEASLEEFQQMRETVIWVMREGDLDEAIEVIKAVIPEAPELKEFESLKWAELAAVDVYAALEGVMGIENIRDRRRNLSSVLEQWAKTDALAVVQWIEEQEGHEKDPLPYSWAIGKLAETQPAVAWSKAQGLSPSIERSNLEKSVVEKWATQDPDAALSWVKALPNGPLRMDYFASMSQHLDLDPEDLLTLVKELGVVSDRSLSASSLDLALSPTSSTSISSYGNSLGQEISQAVFELASESPQKAFEAIYDHVGVDYRSVDSVAQLWVERDPDEAAKWAAGLPENEFTENVQQAIFRAWIKDSVEASAAFLANNEIADKVNLSLMVATEWVAKDTDAAIAWASKLDEGVREIVFQQTLTEVARVDPMQALEYVNHVEDSATQQAILSAASAAWRQRDPEGAMEWLQSQPPDASIDGILKENAKAWVLSQPQAASEWIRSMEMGPRRDHAVAGMVHALISSTNPSKDFEAAESWVNEINDTEIQKQWVDEISKRRP